jgi:hypothetical protein
VPSIRTTTAALDAERMRDASLTSQGSAPLLNGVRVRARHHEIWDIDR